MGHPAERRQMLDASGANRAGIDQHQVVGIGQQIENLGGARAGPGFQRRGRFAWHNGKAVFQRSDHHLAQLLLPGKHPRPTSLAQDPQSASEPGPGKVGIDEHPVGPLTACPAGKAHSRGRRAGRCRDPHERDPAQPFGMPDINRDTNGSSAPGDVAQSALHSAGHSKRSTSSSGETGSAASTAAKGRQRTSRAGRRNCCCRRRRFDLPNDRLRIEQAAAVGREPRGPGPGQIGGRRGHRIPNGLECLGRRECRRARGSHGFQRMPMDLLDAGHAPLLAAVRVGAVDSTVGAGGSAAIAGLVDSAGSIRCCAGPRSNSTPVGAGGRAGAARRCRGADGRRP